MPISSTFTKALVESNSVPIIQNKMHATYDFISPKISAPQKPETKARRMDDQRDDDQGDEHNCSKSLQYNLGEQNFSDESELFSDISNRHRVVNDQDSLEECLNQVYKPSRKQLELLQKHNVVTNGGMLLVDPIGNEKVCLSGHNQSLTNHDLFIVQDGRCREEDEFSLVTEVTYGIEKRDSGRQLSFGGNHNPLMTEAIRPGCGGIFHLENVFDSKRLQSSCGNHDQQNALDVGLTSSDEILVCITSTYIATLDEMNDENGPSITEHNKNIGIRCAWNEPTLSHKLGATFLEGSDGRAYVNQVILSSNAASCGIKRGDVVSFAVPLNHAFRGYEKAVDLVRKLEYIGMRTTYRELFDMFLSKTTSGWPIALVFRREADHKTSNPLTLPMVIRQSAAFMHELVCKCREYDYQQESSWTHELIRGNIKLFFPHPIMREKVAVSSLWTTLTSAFEGISTRNYQPLIPSYFSNMYGSQLVSPVLWRRQFLKTALDDIAVFLYASFTRSSTTDTSIIMSRAYDGSWSDPICVKCAVSDSSMVPLIGSIEYVMLIHDPTILIPLCRHEKVDLFSNGQNSAGQPNLQINESYSNTTLIKYKDSFHVGHDVSFMVIASQVFSLTPSSSIGYISSLHGALKRIEHSSTMYPHPPVPKNLLKFASCDWDLIKSCSATFDLEYPCNYRKGTTLRRYLDALRKNDVEMVEEAREIDIFHQKFKMFLIDGLSVDYLQFSEAMPYLVKGTLSLSILPGEKMDYGNLQFTVKNKSGTNLSIGSMSTVIELDLSLMNSIHQKSLLELDRKTKKRLISIETHDKKKLIFLARTLKDAELLMCGFKLVIEKILLATMETRAHLSTI